MNNENYWNKYQSCASEYSSDRIPTRRPYVELIAHALIKKAATIVATSFNADLK